MIRTDRPYRLAALAFASAMHLAPVSAAADSITLEQAVTLAQQRNAALRDACALQSTVQGEFKDTRSLLWNNPEIALEYRERQLSQTGGADLHRNDTGIGLSQTFELGGQQAARRAAAGAGVHAFEQAIEETRRNVRAEAATRFFQVVSLQKRVQIDTQALEVLQHTTEMVGKRVKAGEDSRLDGNLALVEAERAANQLALANEELIKARSSLATYLQLEPGHLPNVTGNLDVEPANYTLEELLANAGRRPKLLALAAQAQRAKYHLDLERGTTYPDLTVGLSYSPERSIDGQDHITTLSVSLPLPLFRRNATGIGSALTELDQARSERHAAEQAIHTNIVALWQRLGSLRDRVDRIRQFILPGLDENERLSLKALKVGEIGLSEFLLVRRQMLDSQRDLLEARTELQLVRIALENDAGWPDQVAPLSAVCGMEAPQ